MTIKNLKALALTGNSEVSLYVATNVTAVVSSVRITNTTATAQQFSLWVQGPGGTPAKRLIVKDVNVPQVGQGQAASSVSVAGQITLSAGYELRVQGTDSSGGLHVLVSGCER